MQYEFAVPCLFGLEALVGDELKRMDMEDVRVENGRVLFRGAERALVRANLRLRTGERVLLKLGEFPAKTFDQLFEGVKGLPWEQFIPADGAFPVKGHSLDSALHSVPDCQSIVKKAVVERLKQKYKISWFQETGVKYQIQFVLMKDAASLYLDTTGPGLHKRGYRAVGVTAPLRETLAAGIVQLARFRGREAFRDPFCGSGTIAIEAALTALNRAPGLNRSFEARRWAWLPQNLWELEAEEARSKEFDRAYDIWGGDIDPSAVETARNNAKKAGVEKYVRFDTSDARKFCSDAPGTLIVTNPPYGERLLDTRAAAELYRDFGRVCAGQKDWKLYILSAHPDFEREFGRRAVKKRKLYNGMLKCDLFMYY